MFVKMNTRLKNILESFTADEITDNFISLLNAYDADIIAHDGCEFGVSHYDGDLINNDIKYFVPNQKISEIEFYRKTFIIIGQATHSGSLYAMYKAANTKNTNEYPVLVLGDEGGVLTLAKDLQNFMRFLTFNQQPYIGIHQQPYFFDFAQEETENNDAYRTFVKEKFNIDSLVDQNSIMTFVVKPAQDQYQKIIDNYFENYS